MYFDDSDLGPERPVASVTFDRQAIETTMKLNNAAAATAKAMNGWYSIAKADVKLLEMILRVFWDNPAIEIRPTNMTCLSKERGLALKLVRAEFLPAFMAEAQFMARVDSHNEALKITVPFLGALVLKASELIPAVQLRNKVLALHLESFLGHSWMKGEGDCQQDILHASGMMGLMVTSYVKDSFSLTDFIVQRRREVRERVYQAELYYVLAMVVGFVSVMQELIPGSKHHDLKIDNVLVVWSDESTKTDVTKWPLVAPPQLPQADQAPPLLISKPPGFEIAVIDYGLAWRPGGLTCHLQDVTMGIHGIAPVPNPHYDLHTFLNNLRDTLISRPEIGPDKLFRCERELLACMTTIYGQHLLGFGMALSTNQRAAGRGGPSVPDLNLGPQPLVEGRMSALPQLLDIRSNLQEAQVQAAMAVACGKRSLTMFKELVSDRCPQELPEDLFSRDPFRVMFANGYLNLCCDFLPPPRQIFERNLLKLQNFAAQSY